MHNTHRGDSTHPGLMYTKNVISDCECDTIDEIHVLMMNRDGWEMISRFYRSTNIKLVSTCKNYKIQYRIHLKKHKCTTIKKTIFLLYIHVLHAKINNI